jgi:hypothetical protein
VFDYETLDVLRQNHPAWRLLVSPHALLMASFFHKAFVQHNVRVAPQADLVEALEDELFHLRQTLGAEKFPRPALEYLNEWAAPDKGWLRRFYRQDSDEVQFDLTPAAEKAIAWLETLSQRSFVGTESRLLTLFELLRQIIEGSTEAPELRLADLRKRRDAIDAEIEQVAQGRMALLDDTALKDRFMQFDQQARELLSDFREVEHNFRQLDRRVRERIARWEGSKGELLESIMGERDAIADSDHGASFRAFWDFLMSPRRQDEFSEWLDDAMDLPAIASCGPISARAGFIATGWKPVSTRNARWRSCRSSCAASSMTRPGSKIAALWRSCEASSTRRSASGKNCSAQPPPTTSCGSIRLQRPLFSPPFKPKMASMLLEAGDEGLAAGALYAQVVIDKRAIASHIRQSLQTQAHVSLRELCR